MDNWQQHLDAKIDTQKEFLGGSCVTALLLLTGVTPEEISLSDINIEPWEIFHSSFEPTRVLVDDLSSINDLDLNFKGLKVIGFIFDGILGHVAILKTNDDPRESTLIQRMDSSQDRITPIPSSSYLEEALIAKQAGAFESAKVVEYKRINS